MIDRARFASQRRVTLDRFQHDAFDALDAGHSVLVAAPTGSGKTLVAEYAIEQALHRGGKAFYTTPLKALSNQKFVDLSQRYGQARVGLLTGDNTIRSDASLVVMTTEVLRNMIYAESPTLAGLETVVLDEVHYLQDRFRGPVWEEVIIHLDRAVSLVCLSATVSNAQEVAAWIRSVRGATDAVVEERRPVVLRNWYLAGERGRDDLVLLPTFLDETRPGRRPNPEAQRLARGSPAGRHAPRRGRLRTPLRDEVVERLEREAMLPAIVFVFSRAGCEQAVEHARGARVVLTTEEERVRIRRIADAHTAPLDDDELEVLGVAAWQDALEAGLAAHHAGLVPPLKEAVEEAFAAGLVKIVYATETLALGINMPARTVVIEKLTKFTGERHEFLTPGEYTQLTGRAGRRGIDEVGNAVVLWSPFVEFDQVATLAGRGATPLVSAFRPSYNMAANLVARYDRATAHRLLNLSFAQFRADRDVVALERELARARERLDRARSNQVEQGGRANRRGDGARDTRAVVGRAERDVQRLERRVRARGGTLARHFDRVLGLLESWGYVEDWTLTSPGGLLARLSADNEILVSEALRDGLLAGLSVPETAAVVSCFAYERRGPEGDVVTPPFRWPGPRVAEAYRRIERRWRDLSHAEGDFDLPITRPPDPGFTTAIHAWARGKPLSDVLDEETTAGDFVRHVKQTTDLLRQIAEVSPDATVSETARAASGACLRGVVAAASAVGA